VSPRGLSPCLSSMVNQPEGLESQSQEQLALRTYAGWPRPRCRVSADPGEMVVDIASKANRYRDRLAARERMCTT